ncbi:MULTISPECIES: hypothetical protein [unclassified Rhodococcus (in: high G+C Gram-positive bacteria)]|uniref:hypothetical protein n=1 Tax=unclassified Rhodococcus (in: high G+C Gram-positive bacteria) TaxID=192944 RepID=UPI00163996B0|nr:MULTISPECIES: hypothetical protein [unclassified Rhodococcus (in: high G+C Gram-positive bacteria)]MBC2641273.1 hypothetical protein [Rhodococcus sp. 3A]MBC2893982.1 hypothetical protein [Rhodococcus sp. 4CII]
MPLTEQHTTRYADALMTLALAARRPATVVNTGTGYAVRVDFEHSVHLLATNAPGDLSSDPDAQHPWTVRFVQRQIEGEDTQLVEVTGEWLVDAFDRALAALPIPGIGDEPETEPSSPAGCVAPAPAR